MQPTQSLQTYISPLQTRHTVLTGYKQPQRGRVCKRLPSWRALGISIQEGHTPLPPPRAQQPPHHHHLGPSNHHHPGPSQRHQLNMSNYDRINVLTLLLKHGSLWQTNYRENTAEKKYWDYITQTRQLMICDNTLWQLKSCREVVTKISKLRDDKLLKNCFFL